MGKCLRAFWSCQKDVRQWPDRLLFFCNVNGLCVGNSFFKHKNIHKKTWRSPDGPTTNEIDYICINKRWQSVLQDVRSCRGADIGSDHYYLVRGVIKLKLRKIKHQKSSNPYDIRKLKDEEILEKFQTEVTNRFLELQEAAIGDFEEKWQGFKIAVQGAAEETIGRRRGTRKQNWITQKTWELVDRRKEIKHSRDSAKTEEEQQDAKEKYRQADKLVKKYCRKDKRKWFESKCEEAQAAADRNDSRTLYRIVKDLGGSGNSSATTARYVLQTELRRTKCTLG